MGSIGYNISLEISENRLVSANKKVFLVRPEKNDIFLEDFILFIFPIVSKN
jgi:hypothetical protein